MLSDIMYILMRFAGTILGLLFIPCLVGVIVGSVGAAKRRKPGVSFGKAFNHTNVLFRDSLYLDEATPWRKLCMYGYVVVVGLGCVVVVVAIANLPR